MTGALGGLSKAFVFVKQNGYPWSGIVSILEKSTQEGSTTLYFEGDSYSIFLTENDYSADILSYTYPDILDSNNVLDALLFTAAGAEDDEVHLIYNVTLKINTRENASLYSEIRPGLFSWEASAKPKTSQFWKPQSHFVFKVSSIHPELWRRIEDMLYGTATKDPRLPEPQELVDLFEEFVSFKIESFSDGSWTATGDSQVVVDNGDGSFTLNAPTVYLTDSNTFTATSY